MKQDGRNTFLLNTERSQFETIKTRCGFKEASRQLPFFMLWEEFWFAGEVQHANCLYVQEGLEP